MNKRIEKIEENKNLLKFTRIIFICSLSLFILSAWNYSNFGIKLGYLQWLLHLECYF